MRLTAILVLLALPALAHAQVAVGVVQPDPDEDDRYVDDLFINIAECDSAQAKQVRFRWNVQPESGVTFQSGVFRAFAQNQQPTATDGGLAYCKTERNTSTSLEAGPVSEDIETSGTAGFSNNALLSTSRMVSVTGRNCTSSDGAVVYLCIHYFPRDQGGTISTTPRGLASGTLTLSLQTPQTPTLNRVEPGNERLEAHWTAASSGAPARWFRIIAREAGTTTVTAVDESQGSPGSVDGLTNGTLYDVTVLGLSDAGNPSPESGIVTGTPIPADDFWDRYSAAGGQEEGGCATGAAGSLALLGLAAAFARRRAGRRP